MIYQVRANLYFASHDEAVDFYHDCELAFAKSTIINPNNENREDSAIDLIENHHDEDPNAACALIGNRTTEQ